MTIFEENVFGKMS